MSSNKNNKFWRERRIDWKASYFNLDHFHRKTIIDIIQQLEDTGKPVKSVLEIGCGAGANLYNIKKAFPNIKIAGCDINADAIATAKELFTGMKTEDGSAKEYKETDRQRIQRETFGKDSVRGVDVRMDDIDFKVADATELPFHGDSFDLVMTDAFLLYMGKDKIERVLREMRRVGYNRFVFSELHDDSWVGRLNLRIREKNRYYAYDYRKLLSKYFFKEINLFKIEGWGANLWDNYGYVITSLR